MVQVLRNGDRRQAAEAAVIPFLDSVGKGTGGIVGYGQSSRCRFELGVYFESNLVDKIHLEIARRPKIFPIVTPTLTIRFEAVGSPPTEEKSR